MTQHAQMSAVRRSITVEASQARAFEVFTDRFGTWWPKAYSIGEEDMADFVLEPRTGGRWYEIGVDGGECDTGRVLDFQPPERLVLAWHLDGRWQYDPDPAHASEVEIRFIPEGPHRTRVELEHRGFERHVTDGEAVWKGVEGPQGWPYVLDLFGRQVAAEAG